MGGLGMGFLESPVEFCLCHLAVAAAAIAEGVGQDQELVKGLIPQSGLRGSAVEGSKREATLMTFGVGPDRNWIVGGREQVSEWWRAESGGHAPRPLPPFRGKSVFQAMDKKFFEVGQIGTIGERRPMKQTTLLGSLDTGVDLGRTHAQFHCEV